MRSGVLRDSSSARSDTSSRASKVREQHCHLIRMKGQGKPAQSRTCGFDHLNPDVLSNARAFICREHPEATPEANSPLYTHQYRPPGHPTGAITLYTHRCHYPVYPPVPSTQTSQYRPPVHPTSAIDPDTFTSAVRYAHTQ
ncbi:hypothetical protein METBIDRAFT_146432 [Metschnikowia bicuspidata var. bicuspidata NRRL YB-4993]|uniref:Uncharacterized protein n=1 Tax=Metschnikowia bicuspidata var. bicuspidata NRRL YB-4993 TaxID=869754 RepID=A0A1A0HDK9_9ASCO|nr:hypothetical protein METBIDRAFT_146432 [Metschnikowia bicuspidata var. bicuspidata NRRL YB-4993]OBA22101.1 hypothetical protein METBIDRAFT_146432 [Metschnikowia bicuspidata var. bicuspidata NRRL YB-4993]